MGKYEKNEEETGSWKREDGSSCYTVNLYLLLNENEVLDVDFFRRKGLKTTKEFTHLSNSKLKILDIKSTLKFLKIFDFLIRKHLRNLCNLWEIKKYNNSIGILPSSEWQSTN